VGSAVPRWQTLQRRGIVRDYPSCQVHAKCGDWSCSCSINVRWEHVLFGQVQLVRDAVRPAKMKMCFGKLRVVRAPDDIELRCQLWPLQTGQRSLPSPKTFDIPTKPAEPGRADGVAVNSSA